MLELGYIKTVHGCLGVFQFLFHFWRIIIITSFGTLGVCRCYLKGQGNGLLSKRKRRFLLWKDHWPKPSPGQGLLLFLPPTVSVSPAFLLCVFSLRASARNKTEEKYTLKKMLPCKLRSTKAASCCWRSQKKPMSLVPTQTTLLHQSTFSRVVSVFFCFPNMGSSLYQTLHLPCAVSQPRLQC